MRDEKAGRYERANDASSHSVAKSAADDEVQKERPCDLWQPENIAIAMSYFSIGIVSSLISTPLNVYLVEVLNAEPEIQNTVNILQTLPWSLKLLFGFLSDACPINGMRRKPYFVFGALLYSFAFILYAIANIDNVIYLSIAVFLGTLGLIMLDVMTDTMCVERSKFEPDESRGQMQASCYSIRFLGGIIGALLGTVVSDKGPYGLDMTFAQVSFLNGIIPLLLVTPTLFRLREKYRAQNQHILSLAQLEGAVVKAKEVEMSTSPIKIKNARELTVTLTTSNGKERDRLIEKSAHGEADSIAAYGSKNSQTEIARDEDSTPTVREQLHEI